MAGSDMGGPSEDDLVSPGLVEGGKLAVYAGFLDWDGGFR